MDRLIVGLCILAVAASAELGALRFDGRIVNGETIDISKVPYQVAVGYSGAIWCGGSIINERYVLSAAHCFNDKDLEDITVFVGMTSLYEVSLEMMKPAKHITIHPEYVKATNYKDFAIIELKDPLVFGAKVQPVALPSDGDNVPIGEFGYVSGWGRLSENGTASVTLQGTSVKFLDPSVCKFINFDASCMLCAGNLDGSSDSCKGDSGGPLVNNGILYGVVSFGKGCSRPGYPAVYADVKSFIPFIKSVIEE